MALHTTLQIYGAAYDLLCVAVEAAKLMPRDAKPVLGSRIVDRCLEITTLIRRANRAPEKSPDLDQLLERNDEIEALFRVAVEKRFIGRGHYGDAIRLTQSIGRQASGWRKSSSSSPVARPSRQPGPSDLQSGRAARPQGDRHAR
jgi:hypothetical protein